MVVQNGANRPAAFRGMAGVIESQLPMITLEFMCKVPWKRLVVREWVGLVKYINEACICCGARESLYKSCPATPLLYAGLQGVTCLVVSNNDLG